MAEREGQSMWQKFWRSKWLYRQWWFFLGENSGRVMIDTERKIRVESMMMVVLVEKGILQVSLVGRDFCSFVWV